MARKINKVQPLKKIIKNHDIKAQENNDVSSYTFSPKELLHAQVSKEVSYLQFLANTLKYIKEGKRILTFPEIIKRNIILLKKNLIMI